MTEGWRRSGRELCFKKMTLAAVVWHINKTMSTLWFEHTSGLLSPTTLLFTHSPLDSAILTSMLIHQHICRTSSPTAFALASPSVWNVLPSYSHMAHSTYLEFFAPLPSPWATLTTLWKLQHSSLQGSIYNYNFKVVIRIRDILRLPTTIHDMAVIWK